MPAARFYGPIEEPYFEEEDERRFTEQCCGDCRQMIADDERYSAECDAAAEEELERLKQQRPPTLWSRVHYWVARFVCDVGR
jgi:hypothetical protein